MSELFCHAVDVGEYMSPMLGGSGKRPLFSCTYIIVAVMICLCCAMHLTVLADSLPRFSTRRSMAINNAMIASTTSNSTNVNPRRNFLSMRILYPLRYYAPFRDGPVHSVS